mgnify:CR=1 FL=1
MAVPHVDLHLDIQKGLEMNINSEKCNLTTIEIVRARNANVGKISLLFLKDYIRFGTLIEGVKYEIDFD